MRIIKDVDCEKCQNYDTGVFCECIHNKNLKDCFEEATPEMISKRESEKTKICEDYLCQEYIDIVSPITFVEMFKKAKKFTANYKKPRWMLVYAGDDALLASNTFMICEIKCYIPTVLRGKHIARIEPGRVAIATTDPSYATLIPGNKPKLVFPKYEQFFEHRWVIENPDFSKIAKRVKSEYVLGEYIKLSLGEVKLLLNPNCFDTILEELGSINWIGYTDSTSSVIFGSIIGRVTLSPIV